MKLEKLPLIENEEEDGVYLTPIAFNIIAEKLNQTIDAINALQEDTSKKEEKTDVSDTTCQSGLSEVNGGGEGLITLEYRKKEEIDVEALLDEFSELRNKWHEKDSKRMNEIVETLKNAIKQ